MQVIEIIGLTGIGTILLTYIGTSILSYIEDRKEQKEATERDREWQSSPDYIPPPKPPRVTSDPSIRMRW